MICDIVVDVYADALVWAPIFPGSIMGRPNSVDRDFLLWVSVKKESIIDLAFGQLQITEGPLHHSIGDGVPLPGTWVIA